MSGTEHHNPDHYEEFRRAGHRLGAFDPEKDTGPSSGLDVGDAKVSIEHLYKSVRTTVTLGSEALAGLGIIMNAEPELLDLYPEGMTCELTETLDHARTTLIACGFSDENYFVMVAYGSRPDILSLLTAPDVSDSLARIATPKFAAVAAGYVADVGERAINML